MIYIIFFALLTFAPKPFEGAILFSVASPEVKDGHLVIMLSRYGAKAIFDGKNQAFEFLIPKQDSAAYKLNTYGKTYNIVGLAESRRLSETLGRFENYTLDKHGEETLLGYRCQHFTLKTKLRTIELWTTPEILDSDELTKLASAVTLLGLSPRMIDEMKKAGVAGFPLKVRAEEQGKVLLLVAKRVTKRTFSPTAFKIPKGYRPIDEDTTVR
ncbi:MAG: DUF4412 domain-containing protein [Chloroherpetonaceae bacterium]|nr:DUF4412 domain-containing protein [Chloroherpetonaceae bacterium]MCS7211112.1 DUF4412 domain-containing protein [Chloroherpetonaceae bacterium]MDW8019385.1 DUF4412 domain-containing protein [Chloroherpetonaceae bacterium]MDW8466988.1 DUF4412 domain-containing protein [Chloroherpetonaceae bacterium]